MDKNLDKNKKEYTREELVYLAKLYEKAERFEEMFDWIVGYIKLNPKLTIDERNVLSNGFKNIIGKKRSAWRNLQDKKEDIKNNTQNEQLISEVMNTLENEMRKICDDVQIIIDEYLLPNSQKSEFKVFYLKLKADYFRYRAEFTTDNENEEYSIKAEKIYKEAHAIAEKDLHISCSTRLGLDLNYSLFCYEIQNKREEGCSIANQAFEEAIKIIDDLERSKSKETILIIQLLKENLILWNNENEQEQV